ncbi:MULTISPECIES: DNA-binding protein WhiA [Thermoactinomyces]|jgi:cell division protein WhiA|uniref:Probable cell division protein WhiA n=1 Tax=Thermoactinomyces daqus TaxID=1329516 RepID=A0A7W1XAL0_9BACL|nr:MULTISPECIES: DNA-binding protein WhiA [Thermoactinomyces]MBA4543039.1 DNA-binding protein WhiA [Thermoactinomyces daqus]MBH8598700.1 DNA-binding protein WhiA [Thermoactinomyces sp. CICC 10523]MBH8605041.1 DNA-binding protein WhiA [Thermoactinomyces sp. CICC 10522]MBH8606297.1 DNA-binding protein WhiA [Thermoactinomyces sp. CICC 10521]
MSFTSNIKKELTQLDAKPCCKRAILSALVRMNGAVQLQKKAFMLDITTENPSTARYIFSLIKTLYQIQPEVLVRRKVRLKKNNVYMIRLSRQAGEVLYNLGIFKRGTWEQTEGISPAILQKPCCKRAYLRGAFLAAGSVNNPDSASYHLEIVSTYDDHSEALCKLMNEFHLHAKIIERKKGFVVYIKEGDKIGEFLNIIGAHPSLLKFEDARIMKDMRNSVNRLVNCETANLNKTIQAAMRQIENIHLIDREIGLDQLPARLREVAETRLKYPEMNLAELGQVLPSGKVSKSAINHRLRKLDEMARKLRQSSNG